MEEAFNFRINLKNSRNILNLKEVYPFELMLKSKQKKISPERAPIL